MFRSCQLFQILQQTLAAVLQINSLFLFRFLQLFLEIRIQVRMEHLAENTATLRTICIKQLQKFPLGDHGYLLELLRIHPQKGFNLCFHGCKASYQDFFFPILFQIQRCLRCFYGHALPAELRSLIGRVTKHTIYFAFMGKDEFHKGFCTGQCKIAANAVNATIGAADLTKQSKTDGIENRGLPGTGIPADKE